MQPLIDRQRDGKVQLTEFHTSFFLLFFLFFAVASRVRGSYKYAFRRDVFFFPNRIVRVSKK